MQKRSRKRAFRNFRLYLVATLAFYLLFALIAVGVIAVKVNSFPKIPVQEHDVFWANKEQDEFSSEPEGTLYPKEDLLEGGDLYLDTQLLSVYTPLSEGGNHAVRTLYLGDEQALFYLNTDVVCINGQYTSLGAPSILKNGKLCVPLDFFSRCVTGLRISTDEENDRYIVENTGEIFFSFKEALPEESISYEAYLNLVKPEENLNQ